MVSAHTLRSERRKRREARGKISVAKASPQTSQATTASSRNAAGGAERQDAAGRRVSRDSARILGPGDYGLDIALR